MRILLSLFLIFLVSCSESKTRPSNLLDEQKMAAILADVHLAEARVAAFKFRSMDSSVVIYNHLQKEVWKKHEVDTAIYNASYRYYSSNPEELKKVYNLVTQKLSETDTTGQDKSN